MFIMGVGTSAPPKRYAQKECWHALAESASYPLLAPRSRAILRKVLTSDNGIRARHLALDPLAEAFALSPDALHGRFLRHAPELASDASRRALANARLEALDIDALLVSTCTGYLCPGLTSYVGQKLGLRPNILALDLVGQGCGAALPNLRAAEALLTSGRCERVLSVCVEVCSAAFYLDDDPGVLISACLFGDGAGAAVLSRAPNSNRRIEWKLGVSLHRPGDRDQLRFEQKGGMLRNILSPEVPALAARHVDTVLGEGLALAGLSRDRVSGWVLHPGGRDVLRAVRDRLGLDERALRWSEDVLREFGNVSSPSVFFVLERALAEGAPSGYWWMSSFGAGFSCHGALLEVQ
jgi:alkylresorcinol/alkylpyrone synthase